MSNLERELEKNGIFVTRTAGDSMKPMLYDGCKVIIAPPVFPLKKYDIPVYRRDGHYVMHRIMRVTKNGYIICGDNRINLEKDVTDKDIVGVLYAFYHGGRLTLCTDKEYVKYSKKICRNFIFRKIKRLFHNLPLYFFNKI